MELTSEQQILITRVINDNIRLNIYTNNNCIIKFINRMQVKTYIKELIQLTKPTQIKRWDIIIDYIQELQKMIVEPI